MATVERCLAQGRTHAVAAARSGTECTVTVRGRQAGVNRCAGRLSTAWSVDHKAPPNTLAVAMEARMLAPFSGETAPRGHRRCVS